MSKIVVVDDSYAELQLIEGVLKGASHTVVSYPNTEKLEDKLLLERPGRHRVGRGHAWPEWVSSMPRPESRRSF